MAKSTQQRTWSLSVTLKVLRSDGEKVEVDLTEWEFDALRSSAPDTDAFVQAFIDTVREDRIRFSR